VFAAQPDGGPTLAAVSEETTPPIRLGLRENLPQFLLLVGVNALVGG
jgi:hypothetical protein